MAAVMAEPIEARSSGPGERYWRDEILQFVLWMEGEGFGREIDVGLLERALGVDPQHARGHLDRLAAEGLLRCRSGGRCYRLSEQGYEHCEALRSASGATSSRTGQRSQGRHAGQNSPPR